MILNYHAQVLGTKMTSKLKLFLGENVFFDENAFLSQHRHVLICVFESAHTGTRQDKWQVKWNSLPLWKCPFRWRRPFFPSTGMCLYVILHQLTQVLGKKMTFEVKLSFWVKVSFLLKMPFFPNTGMSSYVILNQHTQVLGKKMTSEIKLCLGENVFFDEKCLSFPAQACANMLFCINTHWYSVRKWQVYWNSCEIVFFNDKCPSFSAQACANMWFCISTHWY